MNTYRKAAEAFLTADLPAVKLCTEYMYDTCDGQSIATHTFNHYGLPVPMCEDCYEWLHGRLDPIKIR